MSSDPASHRPAVTCIVSDFGGVLTTPLYDAFVAYSDHCGIELTEFWTAIGALSQARGVNPLAELEVGALTEPEFIGALSAQIASQVRRPVDISDFSRVWFSHLLPNEPMLELMARLKARGLRMGLLTNNVREWEPLWRPRLPVDELFDTVVDSGFVGMRKPDPEIYALTEQRLGVPAEGILFIDDLEVNIEAAILRRWQTVHFRDNAQAIPEIEARVEAGAGQV